MWVWNKISNFKYRQASTRGGTAVATLHYTKANVCTDFQVVLPCCHWCNIDMH